MIASQPTYFTKFEEKKNTDVDKPHFAGNIACDTLLN
jgi:hypothetical protein